MACILPVVNAFPLPKKTVKPADCLFKQNWLFRVGFFLTISGFQTARPPSDVCCRGASAWNGFNHLPGTQIPSGCFPSAPIRQLQNPARPPKKFPGAGPRAYRICNTVCENRGAVPERSGRGPRGTGPCPSTNTGQPTSWTVRQMLNDFPGGLPCGRGCQHFLKHFTDTQKPRRPLRNRAHPQTS